jgi:hypothetical protein
MCRVCTEFKFGSWEFILYYDDDSGADYHYSGADHHHDDCGADYHYSGADHHHADSGADHHHDNSGADYHYSGTNRVQTLQCGLLSD